MCMESGLQETLYLAAYSYEFQSHLKKEKRALKAVALICTAEEQAVSLLSLIL